MRPHKEAWPCVCNRHHRQEDVPVNTRRLWLAVGLGALLGLGRPAAADPPRPLPAVAIPANQKLADAIADRLRDSGQLRHYTIDVVVRGSTVEVRGSVASEPQREEVLRLVQGVPGVDRVLDRLTVAGGITPVQTTAEPPGKLPDPIPNNNGNGNGKMPDPSPLFRAGPPAANAAVAPPRLPPYAWPTYAPYNNYSRVAYPTAYPYNAWPFVGPIYPFPKIPLGWRSVKLEWDDGYWWFARVGCRYDWWRLRFW
jgi:hypothetical protein